MSEIFQPIYFEVGNAYFSGSLVCETSNHLPTNCLHLTINFYDLSYLMSNIFPNLILKTQTLKSGIAANNQSAKYQRLISFTS